ncbi:dimethylguanosine tRNA methyltransferase-like protein [Microdochium nivale]|nr:dimethylguanosine tRNA methyltransferase-like protein [Microdochium nivale]
MDSYAGQRFGSTDTLVSMLQLDPRPMDNDDDDDDGLSTVSEEFLESSTASLKSHTTASTFKSPGRTSPKRTSSLGLSGSGNGRSSIYYLTRIQRYSSYTFTVFAGLHLANTSIIPLIYQSVPSSEPFLLMAREIYQTPLMEPLLVGLPLVAHIASGIALRLVRRNDNLRRYGGATPAFGPQHHSTPSKNTSNHGRSASSISTNSFSSSTSTTGNPWPVFSNISMSGYLFAILLVPHVAINRLLPLLVEGDSSNIGLAYVSHGFARDPIPPWVIYTLMLTFGVGHMVWGAAKWADLAPPVNWRRTTIDRKLRRSRSRAWWGIHAVAAALTGLWAAGGLGVVAAAGRAEGWIGKVYETIYEFRGW